MIVKNGVIFLFFIFFFKYFSYNLKKNNHKRFLVKCSKLYTLCILYDILLYLLYDTLSLDKVNEMIYGMYI